MTNDAHNRNKNPQWQDFIHQIESLVWLGLHQNFVINQHIGNSMCHPLPAKSVCNLPREDMQILGSIHNRWDTWCSFLNLMTNQTQLDTPTTGRLSILGWKHVETAVTNWSLPACTWVDLHENKFLTAQQIKICMFSNTAASSGGKDLVLTRSQEHNQHIAQSSAISSRYYGVIAKYPVHLSRSIRLVALQNF